MNKPYKDGFKSGMAHCKEYGIDHALLYQADKWMYALEHRAEEPIFQYWIGFLAATSAYSKILPYMIKEDR